MSRGAMAFLAGMGTGYMNGEKEKRNQARQDKIDSQRDELHGAKMGEIKRENDDRSALKYAGETVTARPLDGPQPESAYVNGQEPTQPIGYIAGNGPSARTFAGNGVGQEQAAANAMEQNKPEARRTRMADLAMQGNTLAGAALRDNVQTDAALGQLKEQKELQGHREFARGIAGSFQKGWSGFSQFATDKFDDGNTYAATEDGKGGAIIVSTGKDGKEAGRMAFASPEEAITFAVSRADPMKWVDYKTGRADKATEQANKDRDFDLRKKESESTAEYRKRTLAIQGAQEARAGAVHRLAMEDAKIPPGVKLQATSLAKQMEGIGAALNKAMAEDNFNPQSDNAKRLLEQQAALGIQYANLLKDFVPAAKTGTGLPDASVFDKKPAAAPAAVPVARPAPRPAATPGQATPQAQQFNEAGYASVQSTIDGAKRGDARARALLGVMIDRGETTPAQRMQIYEISK